jgi:hypothetical protein
VVRWLAVHPVEARQMGLNGRDQVEKIFNREKSAQKLAALIETLA